MTHPVSLALHHHLLDLADQIRPLPATIGHLATAIGNEDVRLEEVVAVLRDDPSLVAGLLRESNSAASSPAVAISTVESAVTRLGYARVLALATTLAMGGEKHEALPGYGLEAEDLWDHSVGTSYVAEAIVRCATISVAPEVVTAALLHDIGQIVLSKVLDPRHLAQARHEHVLITTAERELVEVDHAELGALLLDLWAVPATIVEAVRYHHEPTLAEGPMAHVVCAADHLAHVLLDSPVPEVAGGTADQLVATSLAVVGAPRASVVELAVPLLQGAGLL